MKNTSREEFFFSFYPTREEVDRWAEGLLEKSRHIACRGEFLETDPIRPEFGNCPNTMQSRFVEFTAEDGHRFYGYWQNAMKTPAPLLINLPGYGGRISMHPQISDDGYHILHISPLGYVTPKGPSMELAMEDGNWPVLCNTALGLAGGYEDWLLDCLAAIRWAAKQEGVLGNGISLYGTSQGGGGALLLASILGSGVRCACADLPFLTGFPMTKLKGSAYGLLKPVCEKMPTEEFWRNLGFVDTLSHAHRLTMPVMLSGGGQDDVCPARTVESLFERLPGTRQYTFLENNIHTHSRESMVLFRNWLRLFA